MARLKQLGPQEAAKFILDDIKNDPTKLEVLHRSRALGENFYVGNLVCSEIYGTPMSGTCEFLDTSFRQKIYQPLGFEVVAKSIIDIPSDAWMLDCLGRGVKNLDF